MEGMACHLCQTALLLLHDSSETVNQFLNDDAPFRPGSKMYI